MRLMTTFCLACTLAHAAVGEGTQATNTAPVAEIVTFRLIDGSDPGTFITRARALEPFLRETGALVHRTLSVDETGLWTDHILWKSQAVAMQASTQMFERPESKPFLAMIAQQDILLRYAPVQMQME